MPDRERFLLNVPETWNTTDLSGQEMAAARARALAETPDPRAKAQVNDFFRTGRELLRSARKHGALFSASTAEMYDDGLFMAYVMVFAVNTPEGLEFTLPVLTQALGTSRRGPSDREVTSVTLPHIGTVARVTGTEETAIAADVSTKLLTMHTMLPVPGSPQEYLVVSCASPNLPLKEAVHPLFNAITATFRFVAPDGAPRPATS
ncbi:hypothetical protein [Kineosporia sp. NBRC 101731]|uniref:hypothetical protein n=1 Tax=Kineosporia sp. NBRC 101731 TaxID=3032199 RepID=UPI0024A5EBC0|nr:hypothetical protein [Kineosporia sp. NBRC 101731]GLY29416.1 hypothetical protein Kisp02_27810 [Kineosporia sp. NBRC 101731]